MRLEQLIQKYNTAGPRYTSYPTAMQFSEDFKQERCLHNISQQQDPEAPLSLYLHIPFCAKICYYCACNKVITQNHERSSRYLEHLHKEIEEHSKHIDIRRPVRQIHFGGGTPTFISEEELGELMAHLRQKFNLVEDEESDFSIEIDPRECSLDKLRTLRALGFTRISLGVQDLNPEVQAAVNRVQAIETIEALLDEARALGFRSINIDLIYGLPLQTADSFARTVEKIIELSPDRLSIFNYAHLPGRFKAQRLIKDSDLPSSSEKLKISTQCIEQLKNGGYRHIGMDHFAKPEDSLSKAQDLGKLHRNFQGYSSHENCDLLSFGASAISQIGPYIYQNHTGIKEYQEAIAEQQTPIHRGLSIDADDHLRAAVIMQLICQFTLDKGQFEDAFDIRFDRYFAEEMHALKEFVRDGLLKLTPTHIRATPTGRFLIRNICMQFDAYVSHEQRTQAFSRII